MPIDLGVKALFKGFFTVGVVASVKRIGRIQKASIDVVGRIQFREDEVGFVERALEVFGQFASQEKAFIERAKSGAIDQVGEIQILKYVLAHVARFGDQTEQLGV